MKTMLKVLALSATVSATLFGGQAMAAATAPTLTLNATILPTADVAIAAGGNANITASTPGTSTTIGPVTNNASVSFDLLSDPANVTLANLFTLTYNANSSTGNSVDLTSVAGNLSLGGAGVVNIPYTLTCTAAPVCTTATATALPNATGGTGIFDSSVVPVVNRVLTFQLDTALGAGGTNAFGAGAYSDIITVTVTAL